MKTYTPENEPPSTPPMQTTIPIVEPPATPSPEAINITQRLSNPDGASGDAAQPAAPKTRKPRSDRGRPRGSKNLDAGSVSGAGVDSGASQYSIDKAIVERTALTVLNTCNGAVARRIGNGALRVAKRAELENPEAIAKELATNASLTQDEGKLMAELTGAIFEKHGLLTGYAPEILLTVLFGEWLARVGLVMRQLAVMEARLNAKTKRDNVSSPSPD